MKVVFATDAWEQYLYWQVTGRRLLKRINLLIRDIMRGDSDGGIGKPERVREKRNAPTSRCPESA